MNARYIARAGWRGIIVRHRLKAGRGLRHPKRHERGLIHLEIVRAHFDRADGRMAVQRDVHACERRCPGGIIGNRDHRAAIGRHEPWREPSGCRRDGCRRKRVQLHDPIGEIIHNVVMRREKVDADRPDNGRDIRGRRDRT